MGKGELFEGLVAAFGFFAACTIIGYIKENYFENKKSKQPSQYGDIDDDDGDLGDFPFTSPNSHYFAGAGAGAGIGMGDGGDDDGLSEEQANMGAIETLVGTADMLVSQGRFEDAKDQYLRALDLVKATMGSSVPLVGYINHELGTICRCMSHYVEADQHFGASAALWGALYDEANKKVNPENNLTFKKMLDDVTDDVMSNNESPLLLLLSYCTNYARALSEQAEVKTLITRSQAQIIGGGAEGTDARPLSEDEVADILVEARKIAEEAINVYSKCFGRPPEDIKHKKVLAGHLRTLTQVAMFQKQWSDAEASVKESLKLLLDSTYPKDPEVITCRMWLSQILMGMNKSEECISVGKELLEVHKGSPEESYFLRYLGEIYSDCDRVSDAEDCFNESLKVCDENLESEAYIESLTLKERKELESERWEIVNSIATLYRNTNRVEESDKILSEMCEKMHCDTPPYTTTSFLRTLQCSIKPYSGSSSSSGSQAYVYGINVLIRQRNEKKVPAGSFLVFSFEDPQSGEMVPMRIEKCVEDSEKTVAMSSQDFVGMRGGRYYRIAIKVLASDHETLLSEHVQLVKCEPLTLSL